MNYDLTGPLGWTCPKVLGDVPASPKNTNGAEHICNLLRMLLLSPHGKLQWGPKGHTSKFTIRVESNDEVR